MLAPLAILFLAWVTSNEHYWANSGERRSLVHAGLTNHMDVFAGVEFAQTLAGGVHGRRWEKPRVDLARCEPTRGAQQPEKIKTTGRKFHGSGSFSVMPH